jgi:hypothetical protein
VRWVVVDQGGRMLALGEGDYLERPRTTHSTGAR